MLSKKALVKEKSKSENTKGKEPKIAMLSQDNAVRRKACWSVNFLSLGIEVGSYFYIRTIDINAGTYTVFAVTANTLEITRVLGIVTGAGNGNRLTKYTYALSAAFVPFTNYTNQGFSETESLNSADNYSNRRYSIKRNIYNYIKMRLTAETKSELIAQYSGDAKNTGHAEAQVAIFTHRISHLTEHLKINKKDFSTELTLIKLVGKRRSLLNYIAKKDIVHYRELIKQLGIRK